MHVWRTGDPKKSPCTPIVQIIFSGSLGSMSSLWVVLNICMSHDMTKPTKWVCTQRWLRSAWVSNQSDQSSLSVWRNLGSIAAHWAQSEDSDQTGRMPRLIRVFAGRTLVLLVLSCRGSYAIKGHEQHHIYNYCSWTVSIKPSLVYSYLVWFPCFLKISFQNLGQP